MSEVLTRAFRLLKIVSRALEPEVRQQIINEVQKHILAPVGMPGDPLQIADWLRNTFMNWLPNVPICECGVVMHASTYSLVPGSEQAFVTDVSSWTGYKSIPGPETFCAKVERAVCPRCHRVRLASRENDVLVLLRTRTGRCGEIAILYTSILIALGYRARLLFTLGDDHLWTEVRIGSEWVPVDVADKDTQRLIKDRFLFVKWGWKLADLYAIEPGQMPVLIDVYSLPK
jgi:hypothetical protein